MIWRKDCWTHRRERCTCRVRAALRNGRGPRSAGPRRSGREFSPDCAYVLHEIRRKVIAESER